MRVQRCVRMDEWMDGRIFCDGVRVAVWSQSSQVMIVAVRWQINAQILVLCPDAKVAGQRQLCGDVRVEVICQICSLEPYLCSGINEN